MAKEKSIVFNSLHCCWKLCSHEPDTSGDSICSQLLGVQDCNKVKNHRGPSSLFMLILGQPGFTTACLEGIVETQPWWP